MHRARTAQTAVALGAAGLNASEMGRKLGIPQPMVRDWLAGKLPGSADRSVNACEYRGHDHVFAELPRSYPYLLGLYLGEGRISPHARGVFRLRVFLDLRYRQIIEDCEAPIADLVPNNKMARWSTYVEHDEPTYVEVSAFSKRWPCLFPQHGPGKKHRRPIFLADWQRELITRWPEQLLRGLIHSDGCRFQNTGRGGWSHPRYSFSQVSDDIRRIFCDARDHFGVHWTAAGKRTIYISRVADVAKLDEFIGPKR